MDKLEINNLHVSVEDKLILKGVNLTINKGEIHALIGPNGQGKSTLLLAIMGHPRYRIDKGSITLNNINLLELEVEERSKLGIFLAMQTPIEIEGVTNIDFLKGIINAHREEPINFFDFVKTLETNSREIGLNLELLNRYLNEGFSGGEKKRNELLQMKLLKPKLALLDEIDSGLDIDGLKTVTTTLKEMKKDDFTALIVSHYAHLYNEIEPDFVHVVFDGEIVCSGDYSLLEKVNEQGYEWIIKELNLQFKDAKVKRPLSSGVCLKKVKMNEKSNN